MTSHLFNRRESLALMAAGTSAALASATASAAAAGPDDSLRTYLRIRSRLDGKPAFYPYRGTIFGRPFGRSAVPLFDVEGFSWNRLTALLDGRYRIDAAEAGYFLDRSTGLPLTGWTNPLNGLATTAKHYHSFAHVIVSDGKLEPITGPSPVPDMQVTMTMTPPTTINSHIWIHEDVIAHFSNKPAASFADPLEYAGPMLEAASLATWCADLSDLADTRRAFVPATLSYQTLGSWRPFMRMGDTPGLISWRMFGTKEPGLDRVPPHLRDRVLKDYPDFLTRDS